MTKIISHLIQTTVSVRHDALSYTSSNKEKTEIIGLHAGFLLKKNFKVGGQKAIGHCF